MINNNDFGKQVTATHVLNKHWRGDGIRTWDTIPVKITGLFIGIRHLQSGYMEQESSEGYTIGEPYWVEHGERIPAALIVENARKNPVYAPLDCVMIGKRETWQGTITGIDTSAYEVGTKLYIHPDKPGALIAGEDGIEHGDLVYVAEDGKLRKAKANDERD